MKLHANAALSLNQRRRMVRRVVEQGWSLTEAAEAAEVSERTCSKWVGRYRAEGEAGLLDRSSAPRSVPHRTPDDRVEAIAALRRLRMTGAEIAVLFGDAALDGLGGADADRAGQALAARAARAAQPLRAPAGRASCCTSTSRSSAGSPGAGHRVTGQRQASTPTGAPAGAARRERGWEFVHVCVDDATRLAYVEVLADEKATTAAGFLRRAVAFYRRHGISVERVMTDNGACYRSTVHALACRALGLRHLRTRPYRPRTNGKAERFIRTLLAGWAYGAIYGTSDERTAALDGWLWTYNHRRPHGALSHKPPIARLNELNNLAGSYT